MQCPCMVLKGEKGEGREGRGRKEREGGEGKGKERREGTERRGREGGEKLKRKFNTMTTKFITMSRSCGYIV